MHGNTKLWQHASRSSITRAVVTLIFCAMALSICVQLPAGQMIKAAVLSAPLESTSASQWSLDLGYKNTDLHPLTLNTLGCPFVDVEIGGVKVSLMFDTGTSRGFVVTNHAPAFPYQIRERQEELNADGSHRGESLGIFVKALSVLGQKFNNVSGSLSDWRMFSSEPFNGTVGLDFFMDRRVTLDYRARRVATTAAALPEKLDPKRYVVVDLVAPPKSQGHILYARARVNRREATVYFDTGYNVSFIDPGFAEGLARIERQGRFKVFRKEVPIDLGGQTFALDELREDPINRGAGFDPPVALTLGSDILSRLVITIDLRAKKMTLALAA